MLTTEQKAAAIAAVKSGNHSSDDFLIAVCGVDTTTPEYAKKHAEYEERNRKEFEGRERWKAERLEKVRLKETNKNKKNPAKTALPQTPRSINIINLLGEEKRSDGLDYIRENNKNLLVKKDNKLVFTKCDLSLTQMKIILLYLGFIFKDDIDLKSLKMPVKKFLFLIGAGSENSTYLNKELQGIISKPIEDIEPDGWTIFSWFTKASCKKGIIEIIPNPELKPYLLNLRQKFTSYSLNYVLSMNSKYDVRLYEIFTSVLGGNLNFRWHVGIDKFKKLLSIENKKFKEINQKILKNIDMSGTDISIEEIVPIKSGGTVVKLVFSIKRIKSKTRSDVHKILFKDRKFIISDNLIKRYQEEYEEIDIYEEIKKMEDWVVRKTDYKNLTQKDWTEFIGGWLKRESDGVYFEDLNGYLYY